MSQTTNHKRRHTVSALTTKVSFLIGGISHVKWIVPHQTTGLVVGNVVTSLGLVDPDLTFAAEVYLFVSVSGIIMIRER